MRDGLIYFEMQEDDVDAFDDVLFPLALGREAEVSPGFSTAIATSAGGHEARTASWAEARTSYDVGPGVRSEADIATLLDFFRARMGPARGFRLRDPFDSSGVDEALGTGDGVATRFALGAALWRFPAPHHAAGGGERVGQGRGGCDGGVQRRGRRLGRTRYRARRRRGGDRELHVRCAGAIRRGPAERVARDIPGEVRRG